MVSHFFSFLRTNVCGSSRSSSISTSTFTLAALAYFSKTFNAGSRIPRSYLEISFRVSFRDSPNILTRPSCETPKWLRMRASFFPTFVGFSREPLPVRIFLLTEICDHQKPCNTGYLSLLCSRTIQEIITSNNGGERQPKLRAFVP
jgi:hypothetical protein